MPDTPTAKMKSTPETAFKKSSSWRLVNLALGLAALLNFAGALGIFQFFPSLVPTRWILAPWLSSSAMATVSSTAMMITRIGLNLWLPASVLMVVFWLTGLHRKLGAPKARYASVGLGLAWAANIAAGFVPLAVSGYGEATGAVMLVVGMFLMPVYLAVVAVGVAAAIVELRSLSRHDGSASSRMPFGLLGWAVLPPVLSLMPLLLAPSNPLALTSREATAFANLCKDVGVRLLEKPSAPVRSVAYDWDPQRMHGRPDVEYIEMDSSGRTGTQGIFDRPRYSGAQKKLVLDFTESRRDGGRSGAATINPGAPYYHFPDFSAKQPYYGVDAFSADVLAFFEVDNPEELRKAPIYQGALRYQITLTDRRSGAVLGVQAYAFDRVNKRACGANTENAISQNVFIYDAINR